MSSIKSRITNRRKALRDLTGLGAIAGMLPLLGRFGDEQSPMSLFPATFAQGAPGIGAGQGNVAFLLGAKMEAVPMAEWEPKSSDAGAEVGRFRIAHGEQDQLVGLGDSFRIPVIGVLAQLGAVARHELFQDPRAGARGLFGELAPIAA